MSEASLKRLVSQWTERYPDTKVDPVNQWDDIITSRQESKICFFCCFFFHFLHFLPKKEILRLSNH